MAAKIRVTLVLFANFFLLYFCSTLMAKTDRIEHYPNFLIIVLDAVRFDFTSLSNPNIGHTPFLAKLAKDGKIFNFSSTYSTYDETLPSHFSLMSGFITGFQSAWDLRQASLAYHLKTLGYETFGISANPNISQKTMASFSAFEKFANLGELWDSISPEEKDKIAETLDKRILAYAGVINNWNRYCVFCSGNKALAFFRDYIKNGGTPFLGFINLFDAHDPYYPDERFYNIDEEEALFKIKAEGDLRSRELPEDQIHPDLIKDETKRQIVKNRLEIAKDRAWCLADDLSADAMEIYKRRYAAEIRELDDYLRQIFEYLEKRDLLSSTIIFLTSDHGESFGEEGFLTHSLSNQGDRESTHRVPLAIYFPKKYKLKGKNISVLASLADIAPTIYDLLGVNWIPLANMSFVGNYGKSLVPYIFQSFDFRHDKEIKIEKIGPEDPSEIEKRKAEALKRLRSLGYIR